MIHIVFQEADIAALEKSFELDETLKAEIIQVKDDYAVGPLIDMYTGTGIENRRQWWRDVLAGGDRDGHVDTGEVDDVKIVNQLKERLDADPDETIWIWAAPNKHDVCSYYWLMSQLKDNTIIRFGCNGGGSSRFSVNNAVGYVSNVWV